MPVTVEAQLKRQPAGGGSLVDWELVADAENAATGRADPVIDYGARQLLGKRYEGGLEPATGTAAASGNTQMIAAPGVGQAIEFRWVSAITDPDQSTSPVIIIKDGAGKEYYRAPVVAHWEPFTLPENTALIINLSEASSVPWTVHYKLVAV